QGYFFLNVQLPAASSLERTDLVCRKVEEILAKTEGVRSYNTVAGFSLLTRITASNNGFYFVALQPWDERGSGHDARSILEGLNRELSRDIPEANAFAFMPPAIAGLGNSGGFSFWLQDRSGGSVELLDQNLQKFLEAARKRPELTGVGSQFTT